MNFGKRWTAIGVAIAISSSVVTLGKPDAAEASPRQLKVTAWTGVSCSPGCSRAGYYDDPVTGTRRSRLQISQGVGDWIVNELGGGVGVDSQYNAISCPQPAGCAAVGTATTAAGSTPFINAGTPLKPKGSSSGANGISCPTSTFCMTVGWFRSASGITKTLTEVMDPVAWKIVPSPNVGALPMMLTAVTCTSRTFCVAVGYLGNATVSEQPYALQWNGVSWSSMPIPVVNAAHTIRLNGVSCTSPTFCVAAGSEQGLTRGTIELRWDGAAWTQMEAPTDLGAQSSDFDFNAVSCSAPNACVAVGHESGVVDAGLVVVWDGSVWSHNPFMGTRPNDALYAAFCATGGCRVAGSQTLSANASPIGTWHGVSTTPGNFAGPAMVNATRGDGWINIKWIPPLVAGPEPIIGYRITTWTGTGADGPSFDFGPEARSATIPESSNSIVGYVRGLTASGPIGGSRDEMLFYGPLGSGPVDITTDWVSNELPRLQQSADYLSLTPAQLQHDAVGILAFILSLSPPSGSTPISDQVVDVGLTSITSTWSVADQPLLVSVANQYALTPSETQKFAVQLVGYLLSLGGN